MESATATERGGLDPAAVTVGKITGGVRSNIIPEQVEMVGTLRALTPDDRTLVHRRVREIATGVGQAMGAEVEVQIPVTTAYPVTYNDPALVARMVPVLQAVIGADRVVTRKPVTGAEDFSFVQEKVPGFYFFIGGRRKDVPVDQAPAHHTPGFHVEDTDLEVGVRYRVLGVKVDQPGSAVLPTSRMGSILRTSTDEELALFDESVDAPGRTAQLAKSAKRNAARTPSGPPSSPGSRTPTPAHSTRAPFS